MDIIYLVAGFFIALVIVAILMTGFWIIQPYEQGLLMVLGSFKRKLNPGLNFVPPLISVVEKLDLRTQTLDVPRQEVITKDNSPTNVDAIIYIKVIEPDKAFFEVQHYKNATIYLAQTTLRSVIGEMELDEILSNRERINNQLRDILDEATDAWGVKVESVEIREVDPSGPVKSAMEAQTSAERQRRAAILLADGAKRSQVLKAEGEKKGAILRAEGVRVSKILYAEGERLSQILNAQGEAQKLRILSVGATTLDQKALTVLSLNALQKMSDGKATKIIFPFEISRLMEGVSEYIGAGRQVPDRPVQDIGDLDRATVMVDKILGEVPKPEEVTAQLEIVGEKAADLSRDAVIPPEEQVSEDALWALPGRAKKPAATPKATGTIKKVTARRVTPK